MGKPHHNLSIFYILPKVAQRSSKLKYSSPESGICFAKSSRFFAERIRCDPESSESPTGEFDI